MSRRACLKNPVPTKGSWQRGAPACLLLSAFVLFPFLLQAAPEEPTESPEVLGEPVASGSDGLSLSRPVHSWEFLDVVGRRAGLFGRESGSFEAWVYPLKLLRNLRLEFHLDDRVLPADSLARTVTVRPEQASILYASDAFSVRQTLFVPVEEPGIVILVDVETAEPLEVRVSFQRDFQLMWPASLGATYMNWSDERRAYVLGEGQGRFFALIGSPSGTNPRPEYATNYSSASASSFSLGLVQKGKERKVVVLAASENQAEAVKTYQRLSARVDSLRQGAARYYRNFLEQTVQVRLPDKRLQQAYDWARVSLLQGVVENPFLGTGLIAGYGLSGRSARPGFAWYFGRDALWSCLALTAMGDFSHARMALEFLIQYQRADGKIPHEVSQSATFVPWFDRFPYPYASADATPLFLIAAHDYVVRSGDQGFAEEHWASLWKTYEFLRSTQDAQGFAQNLGVGHGWVEGGPLVPVRTELYQSGLGVAALSALAELARLTGRKETQEELEEEFARQKERLNQVFWIREKNIFAFGLDEQGEKVERASVLATVPLWFDLLDAEKADKMISHLAAADHATDWGMRIVSSRSDVFHPAGYHFGSVWPLFTGWAAVGEYRYHRPAAAYANLYANALLTLQGSLGCTTEVLSGAYYEPLSTSSPHQIWSSAMVISPLLRGLFGLEIEATENQVRFAPHVPTHWDFLELHNLPACADSLSLAYRRAEGALTLEVQRAASGPCWLEFSPAVSPQAEVLSVEVNDRPLPFRLEPHAADQHVVVKLPLYGGRTSLRIRVRGDFGLQVLLALPPLGEASRNLKVISPSWDSRASQLALAVEGRPGRQYEIWLIGAADIEGVEGAELVSSHSGRKTLRVKIPGDADASEYRRHTILIRFRSRSVQETSETGSSHARTPGGGKEM